MSIQDLLISGLNQFQSNNDLQGAVQKILSSSATDVNTPCSMQVANTNASAGDTVYIKAGTYNNYIAPVNSGTSAANAITS